MSHILNLVDPYMYMQLIGSLMYLFHIGPNICFVVGTFSQFMFELRYKHWISSKHVLRYLRGSISYVKLSKTMEWNQVIVSICSSLGLYQLRFLLSFSYIHNPKVWIYECLHDGSKICSCMNSIWWWLVGCMRNLDKWSSKQNWYHLLVNIFH